MRALCQPHRADHSPVQHMLVRSNGPFPARAQPRVVASRASTTPQDAATTVLELRTNQKPASFGQTRSTLRERATLLALALPPLLLLLLLLLPLLLLPLLLLPLLLPLLLLVQLLQLLHLGPLLVPLLLLLLPLLLALLLPPPALLLCPLLPTCLCKFRVTLLE